VEVLSLDGKIEFLSNVIKCKINSVTLIDRKEYYGLLCKAEEMVK